MENNTGNGDIQVPIQQPLHNQKNSKKALIALLALVIILGFGLGIIYLRVFHKSQIQQVPIQSTNSLTQTSPQVAYLDIPQNLSDSHTTSIPIYTENIDGTHKELFTTIQSDLGQQHQFTPPSLVYTPFTNELIVNTDKGIFAYNLKTKTERTLYTGPTFNMRLYSNNKYVYFEGEKPGILNIQSKEFSITDCLSYWDDGDIEVTGTVICRNGKKIQDISYEKLPAFFPLFVKNNDLYFLTKKSPDINEKLNILEKIDLTNYAITPGTDLPDLANNLANNWRIDLRFWNFKDHFVYNFEQLSEPLSNPTRIGATQLWDFNTNTGELSKIVEYPNVDVANSILYAPIYSRDGKYSIYYASLLGKDLPPTPEKKYYLYSLDKKKTVPLSSFQDYVFLE